MINRKKAAIELSMGTIVVLVLAMSMLILGLVLVKTIFSGAKYNVEQMNDKVQDEINKLFVEEKRIVVYLARNQVDIEQGKDWNVQFAVKNLIKQTDEAPKFTYDISMVEASCKSLKEKEAMSWIRLGKTGSSGIAPGQIYYWRVNFEIPEGAPLCKVRYNIQVKENGQLYASEAFDVSVKG